MPRLDGSFEASAPQSIKVVTAFRTRCAHVHDVISQVRLTLTPWVLGKIEQDYLRRVVLREHGSSSTPLVAPGFITTVTRAALTSGYHVVLEGILDSRSYGPLLRELIAEHPGPVHVFWLQVSFEETVRRHAGRPDMAHVTEQMMRGWYTDRDLLGVPGEQVIGEESGFEQTVTTVLHASGLDQVQALTPCPVVCPRCTEKRQGALLPAGGDR